MHEKKTARESLIHKKSFANYTHRREASACLMIRLDNVLATLCMHALLQFINSSPPFSRIETISTDRVINPTRCPSLIRRARARHYVCGLCVDIGEERTHRFPILIVAHSRKHVTSSG